VKVYIGSACGLVGQVGHCEGIFGSACGLVRQVGHCECI